MTSGFATAVAGGMQRAGGEVVFGAGSMRELLERCAGMFEGRVVLRGVLGEEAMTYGEVAGQAREMVLKMRGWGVGSGDRVATFLPAGMGTMGVMMAVMAGAVYAPLNPRCTEEEARRGLAASRARWVVIEKGVNNAGRKAAEELGVAVIEAAISGGRATLTCARPAGGVGAEEDGLAYVLQTSGTTAAPKVVPARFREMLAGLEHNGRQLAIGEGDRCMHVTPPAHVMGISAMLYSMMGGAEVVCCPGMLAGEFWGWVKQVRPTWLTASPAVHHSIVAKSVGEEETARETGMRFLRTSSAPMTPALWEAVEKLWGAPLIEAWGMSECPLITTNSVRAEGRRKGSVGREAGVEVGVMVDGKILSGAERVGVEGELVIRGGPVMKGYESPAGANEAAFREGWLLTGDVGMVDAEGFVFLRGRVKEMINRGGLKIAPAEIDGVVGRHPAVADVTAFAVPDERLGETVGVAVVLKEGMTASDQELRRFVGGQVGMEKVPERVVFVKELPLGPTGKKLRVGLAEKLGVSARQVEAVKGYAAPEGVEEEVLAEIWKNVLGVTGGLSVEAHFVRDLGGDSMQAVAMLAEASRFFGRELPVSLLVSAGTVRELARALAGVGIEGPKGDVVEIQKGVAGGKVMFCMPGMYGQAFGYYALARRMKEAGVYGLVLPTVQGRSMAGTLEELARDFLRQVREVQKKGPYLLLGYSFGGWLAVEMALQLRVMGEEVEQIVLFDTRGPGYPRRKGLMGRLAYQARRTWGGGMGYVMERIRTRMGRPAWKVRAEARGLEMPRVAKEALELVRAYKKAGVKRYEGRVLLVRAREKPEWLGACVKDETMGWGSVCSKLEIAESGGNHDTMMEGRYAEELARVVGAAVR